MAALIHIVITETADFVYEKQMVSWVKTEFKDIITFDLDNLSDSTLFQYAATLIEKEEKVVIYIDMQNEAGSGKLLGLTETILKNKGKCLVIMKGESKILKKMFSLLKENFTISENIQHIQTLAYKFLLHS